MLENRSGDIAATSPSRLRDPASSLLHFFGAGLAAAGTVVLVGAADGHLRAQIALGLFGASMVAVFLASAVYHAHNGGPRTREILHRLDHAAIFVLIAGTYTPVCVIVLEGAWRVGMLATIWALAAAGIFLKLEAGIGPRRLATLPYLVMGWLSILLIGDIARELPAGALAFLIGGGVVYSLGGLVYALKRPNPLPGRFGFHEVWHVFVMGGALCHYLLMLLYVARHAGT